MQLKILAAVTLLLAVTGCSRFFSQSTPDNQTQAQPTAPPVPAPSPTPAVASTTPTPGTSMKGLDVETRAPLRRNDVPEINELNREYERLSDSVLPCVVSLACTYPVDQTVTDFFNFRLKPNKTAKPKNPDEPPNMAFGSGVIFTHDGYIVTNHHVVAGAESIQVRLTDHRKFSARVIASDESVDLAVIKIDVTGLPALPWGDSENLKIGEQVFAAGNPFNLNDSFSNGIVSAKSRNLNESSYEDFIQTTAAINPGNSGGALVNCQGELVGINAAIASSTGVNMGVGFAIPSNLAKYAVVDLIKNGYLVRGYLGVRYEKELSDDVRQQLGLDTDEGALVDAVEDGSPAQNAGLHAGDFITSVDGHHVTSPAALRLLVAQIPIGNQITLGYIRDGRQATVSVKIGQLTEAVAKGGVGQPEQIPTAEHPATPTEATVVSGIKVDDLNDKTRDKFKIDPENKKPAAVVISLSDDCLAKDLQVQVGDLILKAWVNRGPGHDITTAKDFDDLAKTVKPGESVLLLISHGNDGTGGFVNLSAAKMH